MPAEGVGIAADRRGRNPGADQRIGRRACDGTGRGVAAGTRIRVNLDRRYRRMTLPLRVLGSQPRHFTICGDGNVLYRGTASTTSKLLSLDAWHLRAVDLIAPHTTPNAEAFAWHRLRLRRQSGSALERCPTSLHHRHRSFGRTLRGGAPIRSETALTPPPCCCQQAAKTWTTSLAALDALLCPSALQTARPHILLQSRPAEKGTSVRI